MLLDRPGASLAQRCAGSPLLRTQLLAGLNEADYVALEHDWRFWGRPAQQVPPAPWTLWLLLMGRASGKTRTEGEFAHWKADTLPGSHGALVSRTIADTRDTLVLGVSGLMATQKPWNPCEYIKSDRLVRWANGTTAHLYSSEEPDQLRGPNHHWGVGDEVAAWKAKKAADGMSALDHLRLSTRLRWERVPPQLVLGTTPRRTEVMKALLHEALNREMAWLSRGHMRDNRANLSPEFVRQIEERYKGTRLARQELAGELVDAVEGAILSLDVIDEARADLPLKDGRPDLSFLDRIVVAVDPSGGSDLQGVVAAGRAPKCPCGNGAPQPHGWVLTDVSANRTPVGWGSAAVNLYRTWKADRIVGERNFGGDMVEHTVRTAPGGRFVRYKNVVASRGKHVRAEPVLGIYEQRRIHHVGVFPELEDELCAFTPDAYGGDGSPNRADAAVWAFTELLTQPFRQVRIN